MSHRKHQESYRRSRVVVCVLLLLSSLALLTGVQARAQKKPKRTTGTSQARTPQAKQAQPVDPLAESRSEFIRITKEYKASLAQLIGFYEADARKAEEQLTKLKELQAEGLLSKRALDEGAQAVVAAQAKVSDARAQLTKADEQIAETLVEAQVSEQMERDAARARAVKPQPRGTVIRTTAYIRYEGTGGWSLSGAASVQRFYAERFGRSLPVSAFGQSGVHDRWGLDHRNAMDVGINPDSVEGQALTAYLRANGIPFMAFRYAIPGAATAPHIHVGRPSHRIK
jgi:hypothetical protein